MALKHLLPVALLACMSCSDSTTAINNDSVYADSLTRTSLTADSLATANTSTDTVFHTALPTVFDGDIIMENYGSPQGIEWSGLMGDKYNHIGIIFQRQKDGILCVAEVTDSVSVTELTTFVDRAEGGHVALLRIKNANMTLTEEKVKALRQATKAYKGVPADMVLNWDDSHLYPAEFVWKAYNNAMRLTLCPTRKVADFGISADKQKEVGKTYGGVVSEKDEAVSIDDIYNSEKLEIVYEK